MRELLLQRLREPGTGAELELIAGERRGEEIWTGRLRSVSSGRCFDIEGGIPRFVSGANYSQSFGLQWGRFSRAQLDSATGAAYSRRRFDAETGWQRGDLENRWVLDGGCGAGRFAEIAAERGGQVVALDSSSAVEAAQANLAGYPNAHVVQGDLLNPPFATGSFDFVYSIGVLQHTPDPYRALGAALSMCRPGGRFAFTAYARRWYTPLYAKYLVRPVTKRLPPRLLLRLIETSMVPLFPVTDRLFRVPVLGKVASFVIPVASYADRDGFSREQRFAEAVLDTFDMLAPAHDHPLSADRVEALLRHAGVASLEFRRKVPIEVTGRA